MSREARATELDTALEQLRAGQRELGARRGHADLRPLLAATIEATPALLRVDAAGLLLVEPSGLLRPVAASDRGIGMLDALQTDLEEGPALDAARDVVPSLAADLEVDVRWRRLGRAAATHRVHALLAVSVLADEDNPDDTVAAGVLELVCQRPHPWTGEEVRAGVAHGATLSRLLRVALAAGQARERAEQLQRLLNRQAVVEQAKGILMERDRLLPAQALRLLRVMSRLTKRRIGDVAADIIADRHG
jgi:hypothetical protein